MGCCPSALGRPEATLEVLVFRCFQGEMNYMEKVSILVFTLCLNLAMQHRLTSIYRWPFPRQPPFSRLPLEPVFHKSEKRSGAFKKGRTFTFWSFKSSRSATGKASEPASIRF